MIFLDTETTGLPKTSATKLNMQPYILEISAIATDDDLNITNEINTYIKPPVDIPDFITKINGIDNNTVKKAPTFIKICDELSYFFLGEDTVIGHNVTFDLTMLRYELMRHDLHYHFPWPINWICTVECSQSIRHRRLKLEQLHELATGKKHKNAHRARSDVKALITCYDWLRIGGYID